MKSKKINLMETVNSAEATIQLLNLLEDFRIPSAQSINEEAKYILDNEMCHTCAEHVDNCYCRENGYQGRYAEYDDGADYED